MHHCVLWAKLRILSGLNGILRFVGRFTVSRWNFGSLPQQIDVGYRTEGDRWEPYIPSLFPGFYLPPVTVPAQWTLLSYLASMLQDHIYISAHLG